MKRSSYRGQHKGSTLKARTKIAFSRTWNIVLAFVLVVGVAPSMSFASNASEAPDPAPVADNTAPADSEPSESSEVEDADEAAAEVPAATPTKGQASPKRLSKSLAPQSDDGPTVSAPVVKAGGAELSPIDDAYISNQQITVTFLVRNVSDENDITVEGTYGSISPSKTSTGVTLTFPSADTAYTGSVTVKVGSGENESTQTFNSKVVVDTKAPELATDSGKFDVEAVHFDGSSKTAYIDLDGEAKAKLSIEAVDTLSGVNADDSKLKVTFANSSNVATASLESDGTLDKEFASKDFLSTNDELDTAKGELVLADKAGNSQTYILKYDSSTKKVKFVAKTGSEEGDSFTSENAYLLKKLEIGSVETVSTDTAKVSPAGADIDYYNGNVKFKVTDAGQLLDTAKTITFVGESTGASSAWDTENKVLTVTVAATDGDLKNYSSLKTAVTSKHETTLEITRPAFAIDKKAPVISVTHGDAATAVASGGEATVGASEDILVKVTDPLFDSTKTTVKIGDAAQSDLTWTQDSDTWSAPLQLASEDGQITSNAIEVTSTDQLGNAATPYTATLKVDKQGPAVAIEWTNDPAENKTVGGTTYYKSRTATITVEADDLDTANIENDDVIKIESTGGAITTSGDKKWTSAGAGTNKWTAEVKFTSDAPDCALTVTANDTRGNATVKDGGGTFTIMNHPILDVAFNPDTAHPAKSVYALKDGKLTVTLTVTDPYLESAPTGITATDSRLSSTNLDWTQSTTDPAKWTATLEYTAASESSTLEVATPAGGNYVGTMTTTLSGGKFTRAFSIDVEPPKLVSVEFSPAHHSLSDDGKQLYFNATTTATVKVEEADTVAGAPIKVSDGTNDNFVPTISGGGWVYTVPFTGTSGQTKDYTFTVGGSDYAGNKLILKEESSGLSTYFSNNEYQSTVTVDMKAPTLDVTFDKAADEDGKIYSNKTVTATITVVDTNLGNATAVTLKQGDGSPEAKSLTLKEGSTDTYECTVPIDLESGTSEFTLEVAGEDAAGNKLVKAEASTITVSSDGKYTQTIVLDKTNPELTVGFDSDPQGKVETTGETPKYYFNAGTPTLTGKVTDDVKLLKEAIGVTVKQGETEKYRATGPADAAGKTFDKIFGEAGYAFPTDTNAVYDVAIGGTDAAGNGFTASTEMGNAAAAGIKADGTYAAQVIYDTTAPTVAVSYNSTDSSAGATALADKDEVQTPDDQYVFITVTEDLSFDDSKFTITGVPAANVTHTEGSKEWKVLVSCDAGDETDVVLGISGKDLATNPLADFSATFKMDKKGPQTSVSWSPTPSEGGYYNTTLTATITVEETNFDSSRMSVSTGTSQATVGAWNGKTCTVTFSADGVYQLTVSGTDTHNNPGNTYTSPRFTIDKTAPQASVSWNTSAARNGKYYNTARTATITITETNFNASDYTVSPAGSWSGNTCTVTFANDGAYTLSVNGRDPAGNNLSNPISEPEFVIDRTAPTVLVTFDQTPVGSFGNVDYYNAAATLGVNVAVTDANFNPQTDASTGESATNIAATGTTAAYNRANWSNGNYRLAFTPNDAAGAPATNTLSVTAFDLAGNSATVAYGGMESNGNRIVGPTGTPITAHGAFALDITAPAIAPGNAANIPNRTFSNNYGDVLVFYRNATTLGIVINDALGIRSVTGVGSDYSFTSVSGAEGDRSWETSIALRDGTEFTSEFLITAIDLATNVRQWRINPKTLEIHDVAQSDPTNTPLYADFANLYPRALILDTVAPTVALDGATPGQYYNTTQTITTTVNELNFRYLQQYDGSQVITTMTKQEGNAGRATSTTAIPVSQFSGSGSLFTNLVTLPDDGHYSFAAHVSDPAGNEGTATLGEFTIDKTPPTATVAWDNNNARNGMYYNAARTATITVTEHNFDAAGFTVTSNGAIGGWSSSGDTHTCTVSFTTDGRYTLSVSGRDQAGNAMTDITEPEFVVDLTAPTIDFSNVVAQTAYNDVIAPTINYHDEANFDSAGMSWTLTGSKHGSQRLAASEGASGNDGTVAFADFTREVEYDDIYTLDAHLTDMAGNEADNTVTFSVNRFGSNFIIEDADDYAENNGYMAEPREIQVREVNVSGALSEQHSVSVTHGLNTENLERRASGTPTSTGFYIVAGSDNAGWSSYVYHIGSGNFSDDGNYHVVISSTDAATNLNNSASYYNPDEHQVADAEVSFILDTADPIIDGISVSDGGTYNAADSSVTFTVTDNIGFDSVKVTVDGDTQNIEPEMGGLCTVDLPAKTFAPRTMDIVATDYAGRTAEASVTDFHYTSDFLELNLPLVVGGAAGVVAVGAGATVFFIRRRHI